MLPGRKSEFRIDGDEKTEKGEGYCEEIASDSVKVIDRKTKNIHFIEKEFLKPLVTNSQIKKYALLEKNNFLTYTVPLQDGRLNIDDFKGILGYLKVYEEELKARYDYDGEKYPWYGYQRLQNVDLFENSTEKIVCPYRAKENRFALDEKGHFGTSDMYALVPKSNTLDVSLFYLLGILNSKVLNFWYRTAGKLKGKTMEFFATPLSKMPIPLPLKEKRKIIEDKVSQIIELKKIFLDYRKLWRSIRQNYGNDEKTLQKILLNDKTQIQKGNFEETLVKKADLYPDTDKTILSKQFDDFKINLNGEHTLKIYGINKSAESLLLTLETNKKGFRDIIFLEMLELLDSRRKVNSLRDFFRKTDIAIIKPNPWENTDNLIGYLNAEIKEYLEKGSCNLKAEEIIFSEQKIGKLQHSVDALVFEIFSLSEDEIETILNSLATTESEKRNILKDLF